MYVLIDLSKKVTTHPDIAHPATAIPRSPTMKGFPAYSLLLQVAWGVFQRCVETTVDNPCGDCYRLDPWTRKKQLGPYAFERHKNKNIWILMDM